MNLRRRPLFFSLLTVIGLSMACADITGLSGSTVYVDLNDAGQLGAGDAVVLSGIEIGSVVEVGFQEGSNSPRATLSISNEHLSRLDPQTLFMVRQTEGSPPERVLVASNVCTEAPQGVSEGQSMKGYAGRMAKVLLLAAADNPACATRLVEQWVSDLDSALSGLNSGD